jgi:hypothetical protein
MNGERAPYLTKARDYLARAERRLQEASDEALFYAAFELRAGIQQRLREYLAIREELSDRQRAGWRIPNLAAALGSVFEIGDFNVEISLARHGSSESDERRSFLFTPVTSELQVQAGMLGDLLHAADLFRSSDDPWWGRTRALLEKTAGGLRAATAGRLLGPPLFDPATGDVHIPVEANGPDDIDSYESILGKPPTKILMSVRYTKSVI